MISVIENTGRKNIAYVDMDGSPADKYYMDVVRPIKLVRWGYIVSTVLGSDTLVAALDLRPTINSDSERVDAWGGTITPGVATAAGKGAVHTLLPGEGARDNPIADGVAIPGEQLVVEITTGASSGVGWWFIEYQALSNVGSYLTTGEYGNLTEYAS